MEFTKKTQRVHVSPKLQGRFHIESTDTLNTRRQVGLGWIGSLIARVYNSIERKDLVLFFFFSTLAKEA